MATVRVSFTLYGVYQAYCILLVHYCHVTRRGQIRFQI